MLWVAGDASIAHLSATGEILATAQSPHFTLEPEGQEEFLAEAKARHELLLKQMADSLQQQTDTVAELEQKHRLQVQIISTKMREEMNFQLPALEERLRAEAAERSAAELAAAREQHGREMAELTARYVRLDFTVNFLSKVYAI